MMMMMFLPWPPTRSPWMACHRLSHWYSQTSFCLRDDFVPFSKMFSPWKCIYYPCVHQFEGDRSSLGENPQVPSCPIITESGLQSYYNLSGIISKQDFFLFRQLDDKRSNTTRYKENCKPNDAGYWIRILFNEARCIVTSAGVPSINTQRQGILKYTAQGSSPREKRTQGTGNKVLMKAT